MNRHRVTPVKVLLHSSSKMSSFESLLELHRGLEDVMAALISTHTHKVLHGIATNATMVAIQGVLVII